jgi:hypothetical protein
MSPENTIPAESAELTERSRKLLLKAESLICGEIEGPLGDEPVEVGILDSTFPDGRQITVSYNPNGFPEAVGLDVDTKIQIETNRSSKGKDGVITITTYRTYIRGDGYYVTVTETKREYPDGKVLPPVFGHSSFKDSELNRAELSVDKIRKNQSEERNDYDF